MRPLTAFDCDFEIDSCPSWNIISKPELTWKRVQALAASQDDAHNPLYDHTENQVKGYYLLLQPNQTLLLSSVSKIKTIESQTNIFRLSLT
jgi:hypothetical protein